jgi:hypothetical protein
MNLSIIGNPEMDESIGRRKRAERKADREKRREDRRADGKPSRVKKVLLAVPRTAFLGLIRLNVRGLATRLSNANKKDPAKVKAMWLRLGGDPNKFVDAFTKGATKRRLLGTEEMEFLAINGVGEPTTAAALLASAAPIVAVVAKFLKDNNITEGAGESLADIMPEPGTEISTETAAADPETPDAKAAQPTATSSSSTGGMMTSPTTGLLIGAALLAALFLFKKKK